jgi:methionyl-tRNA formyltransferase
MTHQQFLRTTSSQLNALQNRHKIKTQLADYRAALITSILYNVNRGDNPTRSAASFFSSLAEFEETEVKQVEVVKTADQQLDFLEALFGPAPMR